MMRLLRLFLRNRSGAAAAEMALVTPLLVAILFGTMEAGYYFWNEHIVVKAVRDGARFAGRQPFAKFSCTGVNDTALETSIKNLTRTGKLTGGTSRVVGWTDAQVSVTASCLSGQGGMYASYAGSAPRVTVSTTVTYQPLFRVLVFRNIKLIASAQSPVMGT
jgi:Flp pilus assembly protein TadG